MTFRDGIWLNEPKVWREQDGVLDVTTETGSDFWRETHYGFKRDSGHFLGVETAGDFSAQLRVQGGYEALYDQAGIMVRLDEQRWVKAGIELCDGRAMLGSVLTDGSSDWATAPFEHDARDLWLRATVKQGVLRLQVSADGTHWPLLRLAPFPKAVSYRVGPMCCSPERAGLRVRFSSFRLSPPLEKDLHDLS